MQAISLMSQAVGQATSVPAQGGTQTATTANAGLFQGMLLEALLGGQISPELAAQLQAAPQTGQTPGVLLSGPAAPGVVPAQPPAAAVAPTAALTPTAAPAPTTAPAPDAQTAPTAPTTDAPAQEAAAPTPAPTEPAVLVVAPAPAPLSDEETGTAGMPAAPKTKETPAGEPAPTPDAVVAQVLAQGQPVIQPAPAQQPADQAPQATAPATVVEQVAADPQLEAFVQRAVKLAQGETPEAPPAETKVPAGPTFQDLIKLVAGADQAGGPKPEAGQNPQAGAQPQPQPRPQAQTQSRPGAQAAPEQHDTVAAPAPAKAPKAVESPEKAADVTLAQAPRPAVHEAATAASDASQAAPRQPVDPEQVLRQVSRFVKVMVDSKQSEVRLQLHPENLGTVGVRLVLGDGALKANLVAQDAAVKAALEANLDQLKSRLSDQGFQVEQVHVTVGGGDGFGQPQHSRQGEQRQPQQAWRSQPWLKAKDEESSPVPYQQRTTPTWCLLGTGARINSLV